MVKRLGVTAGVRVKGKQKSYRVDFAVINVGLSLSIFLRLKLKTSKRHKTCASTLTFEHSFLIYPSRNYHVTPAFAYF